MVQWLLDLFRRRPRAADRVPPPSPEPARAGDAARLHDSPAPARPARRIAVGSVPDGIAPPALPAERIDAAVAALRAYTESQPPELGSFPGTAERILQLFRAAEPDFNRVVHELQQDAAVAAKLLNVANSAFFGGSEVKEIRAAITRIGMRDVSKIALAIAGQSLFEPTSRSAFSLAPHKWQELFHTSMVAAFASAWLSEATRVGRSDHAFLAGLLHDVGQPLALRALAQLVIEGVLGADILDAADPILDRVHVELGARVASDGGLPAYLCAAALRHHAAELPGEPGLAEVHLVRIVDGIALRRRGALIPVQELAMESSSAALSLDRRWTRVAATEYESLASQVSRMFGVPDPWAGGAARATPPI
jgi:HD-like signal output (HDOD) protein